jgi:RNA polymerase sigma factor (sigma-70 family)
MDDLKILELIRSGRNDKALARLYQHLPPIRRMIRYYGGDRQQAEDIFQESLIILCRKVQSDAAFTLSAGIYPYLYSVCRFLWKDEAAKQRRGRTEMLNVDDSDAAETGIESALRDEARYRLAEKIISELGDRCRELLVLFYQGRVQLREIAERMGYSSEQTAKNQKYKCLEGARNKYLQQAQTNNF